MIAKKPKPCKQKECPFWNHCKFGHDQNKCRVAVSAVTDDVIEID